MGLAEASLGKAAAGGGGRRRRHPCAASAAASGHLNLLQTRCPAVGYLARTCRGSRPCAYTATTSGSISRAAAVTRGSRGVALPVTTAHVRAAALRRAMRLGSAPWARRAGRPATKRENKYSGGGGSRRGGDTRAAWSAGPRCAPGAPPGS